MDVEIFDSGKKKLRIQKYPKTFGRGLNQKLRVTLIKVRKSCFLRFKDQKHLLSVFIFFFTCLVDSDSYRFVIAAAVD